MPFQPESEMELNIKDLENFPISPTVISKPLYDKWFESYGFLKSAGLPKFWVDQIFDLDWQRSRKILLIEYGAESGEMSNVKVIDNFENSPESTNTLSSDQRLGSYGPWNLGRCQFWTDWTVWKKLDFKPTSKRILVEPLNIKILQNFVTFLTVGRTQNFDLG
jgi:hypothetical protein